LVATNLKMTAKWKQLIFGSLRLSSGELTCFSWNSWVLK